MMNHRDTWAEERNAPTRAQWEEMLREESAPRKRKPRDEPKTEPATAPAPTPAGPPKILIRRKVS